MYISLHKNGFASKMVAYNDIVVGFSLLSSVVLSSLPHLIAILLHGHQSLAHHGNEIFTGDGFVLLGMRASWVAMVTLVGSRRTFVTVHSTHTP